MTPEPLETVRLHPVVQARTDPRGTGTVTFGAEPQRVALPRPALLLVLVMAQAVLGRVIFLRPTVGLVQAAVIVGLVVYAVARRDAMLCLLLSAYITGAEIVWRQARAPVPYQLGPYLMILISVLAVILVYPAINHLGRRALLYVGLLIPSATLTIAATAGNARQLIAFSLAGPLAIAVLIVWLSQVAVAPWLYRRMLWTLAITGVGPLAIAATNLSDYLGTGEQLVFSDASNFTASGGFGPVQVSSVLGLTVLACVLLAIVETEFVARVLAGLVGAAAAVQSLLTFSRGGMFSTAFAVAALALMLANNPQGRRRAVAVVAVVFALGYFVVIPRLDNFTQGAFKERFTNTETGRTDLASSDLDVFAEHPIFGVGPGMTKYQRLSYDVCKLRNDACKDEASSHTEFTRMLSEHGAVGIVSLVILLSLAWGAIVRATNDRYLAVTFLVWSMAQMFYANIRIVAVAFAFAVAFIRVVGEDEVRDAPVEEHDGRRRRPVPVARARPDRSWDPTAEVPGAAL
ncbi:MAG: O-antigen ligase family protein [Acidimicrobiales bacterium]|nr:O-antigen ligase family protein [Acidimicrobiales bacterium]HRW36553.1 O-antigen ligase family protein [Aquihabitans sp.]